MITEAIILAGGLGTRLTNVKDVPKAMAPINNVPFLQILMDDLLVKGITTFYLAVGYKREIIIEYFGSSYMGCKINYVIEEEPLGTGGAIKRALAHVKSENVLIVNGDTFFDVDVEELEDFHHSKKADVTLALKPLENFDRYGTVVYDDEFRITNFSEKKFCKKGVINGGIYLLKSNLFDSISLPEKFSMETDFFEKYHSEKKIYGYTSEGFFIDIGIPEDFERAQKEL